MKNTQAYQTKEDIILEKLLQDTGKIDSKILKEAVSQQDYMVEQGDIPMSLGNAGEHQ